MKAKYDFTPSIARILDVNPIADSIGFLNLESIDGSDIKDFAVTARETLMQTNVNPTTEAGFDMNKDLSRFVREWIYS